MLGTAWPPPIGIFGGTFDPIHLGHLRLAEELGDALGCAEVRFIPTGTPPHRDAPRASAAARRAMVALAIADNPRFVLDERELTRSGPCYMFDTLTSIRAEVGAHTPLVLFLGGDAFLGLTAWHRWTELFALAHVAIGHRPGFGPAAWGDTLPEALHQCLENRATAGLSDIQSAPAGRIYLCAMTQMDIAARRIRSACQRGASVRYLVPIAVAAYLEHHPLYQN
jgi:nicotinate-nucleotide adenylyltransferase